MEDWKKYPVFMSNVRVHQLKREVVTVAEFCRAESRPDVEIQCARWLVAT